MTKKSRFLQVPIEPFRVEAGLTPEGILERMERISFQGRSLATAHRVWQKMLEDEVAIFMGVAGALSAGGEYGGIGSDFRIWAWRMRGTVAF